MVRPANEREYAELKQLVARLNEARKRPTVRVAFKDGRVLDGAITFVERLGTGRLINVDREFALAFSVYDVQSVDF